jgi:NADH dehydrogenase FAD-containing subunit
MGKRLVLVGGGHAHMLTLANLQQIIARGHRVTVIGPSAYHYYSGMGPGMLGKTYAPKEIRFATRQVVEKQGGEFILDAVTSINPQEKTIFLDSGNTATYDVLSFNAGSFVPNDLVTDNQGDIFYVKPIEGLITAQQRLLELTGRKRITIGIVGGGPSAAEIGGNVWQLTNQAGHIQPRILIFAGNKFMARFPSRVRKRIRRILTGRGIEIIESGYVSSVATGHITTEAGRQYRTDLIFMALGIRPSPIIADSGLPVGPDGGLLVNRFLQAIDQPDIFGGGDCVYFKEQPLDKVGVYAVRENPVLYHNLMARLENETLMPFDPDGNYLLIFNLGGGQAVLHKGWLTLHGRLAFRIKDYIDRKFMKKFQASE